MVTPSWSLDGRHYVQVDICDAAIKQVNKRLKELFGEFSKTVAEHLVEGFHQCFLIYSFLSSCYIPVMVPCLCSGGFSQKQKIKDI